jgi:hypothetical protein
MRKAIVKVIHSAISEKDLMKKLESYQKDGWTKKSQKPIFDDKYRRWFLVITKLS